MSHETKEPKQATLFRGETAIEGKVRSLVAEAIKRSGLSREEVAARVSVILGRHVTVSTIREITRNPTLKHQFRFPLAWAPALCEAVGDWSLLREVLPAELRSALEAAERIGESKQALRRALAAVEALEQRPGAGKSRRSKRSK